MKENWKDIKGYEGSYCVSNTGKVKSLGYLQYDINNKTYNFIKREKILIGQDTKKGYLLVRLYKNGKYKIVSIHRLVAQAFIPNPNNLPQVNHKDENKSNNCVDNLEWCDNKYNCNYGTRTKRMSETLKNRNCKKVYQYNKLMKLLNIYKSISEASKVNNFSTSGIAQCCNNKIKTYKGYIWKYEEV